MNSFRNRYILRLSLVLTAMLSTATAMAQDETPTGVVVKGSVYGGGNQADVKINSTVNMSAGQVEGNVYGGGNLGDVGTHVDLDEPSVGNYTWTANTGLSQVVMSGGTVGPTGQNATIDGDHGNVFGGGKGAATTFECEKGMVYQTNVSISTTGSVVKGNVYGGGKVSRVEGNTVVTIGTASGTDEPTIEGNVFAAGAGIETHGYSALVRGASTVTVQGKAQIWKNVYGGGELASVGRYKVKTPANKTDEDVPATLPMGMPARLLEGGTSSVNIQDNAAIGTDGDDTTGHVYGAGQGLVPNMNYDYQTQAQYGAIEGNNAADYVEDDHKPKRMISGDTWEYFADVAAYLQFVETLALSAETHVTIGGKRDETTGNITSLGSPTIMGSVFGGSESGFVYKNADVQIKNGTIDGSAFGGGRGLESFAEAGRVRGNTVVAMSNGTVKGNVYGGGNLGDVGTIYKDARDNKNNLTYNYIWRNSDANGNVNDTNTDHQNTAGYNVPSGSSHDTSKNTGICTVTITGGTIGTQGGSTAEHASGHVFGAGKGSSTTWWCEKAIAYATVVSVSGSTLVYGNVYGGGQVGRVEDDGKVTIGTVNESGNDAKPIITGSVFGAGAGIYTHGYSALLRGNSDVTVQGAAQVGGSVYGGGEIASVGRFTVVGGLPKHPDSGGYCTVTIQDNAKIGTSGTTHNVFGACKGVDPTTVSERKSMQLVNNKPEGEKGTTWDEYEDENGNKDARFIWRKYTADEYPAFLRTLALTSHPHVTISENANVYGSVYGGGEMGITLGNVDVDITGGTVAQNVYGGGALADTNTGNWDAERYVAATVTAGETIVTGMYTRNGAGTDASPYVYTEITAENTKAVSGTTYYKKGGWKNEKNDATTDPKESALYTTNVNVVGGTVNNVFGGALGRRAGDGKTAIEAKVYGDVKVNLNGIDKSYYDAADASLQTIFDGLISKTSGATEYPLQGDKKGAIVNRVFGANDTNGSPQGYVTVHVFATQSRNASKTTISGKFINDNDDLEQSSSEANATYIPRLQTALTGWIELATALSISVSSETNDLKEAEVPVGETDQNTLKTNIKNAIDNLMESVYAPAHSTALNNLIYDVKAVYGGGNEAAYVPMSTNTAEIISESSVSEPNGPITKVIIEGCEETTIETVYGGGNAASVPETYVNVKSAHEIETVFGGGNGKDATSYGANPGADVGVYKNSSNTEVRYGTGHTNSNVQGGYIHELFGASNEKGQIKGSPKIKSEEEGDCPMVIGTVYNAGKNADIDGDMIAILGCMPSSKIKEYYGGAQNANVKGNVELTITSGNFGKVFAGNKTSGSIFGHIKINIEETGNCDVPIRIDELYGCGNEAAYSVYGYYQAKKKEVTKTVEGQSVTSLFMDVDGTIPLYEDGGNYYKDEGKTIPLYIDNNNNFLYINEEKTRPLYMPRRSANDNNVAVFFGDGTSNDHTKPNASTGQYANPEVNIISCTHIGKVFGGGYGTGAVVYGDPHVNINMLKGSNYSAIVTTDNTDGLGEIVDVYGGGNAADVIGNPTVNICTVSTVKLHQSYNATTDEYSYSGDQNVLGAYITGNVYGGGKGEADNFFCDKAMIGKDNDGIANPDGGTTVNIYNGTVRGNVYGGGQIGRVEKNTVVTIGTGDGVAPGGTVTSAPIIMGSVYGGGAGEEEHGYAALVRGNPTVTIQGNAKVRHSVYGGGEIASVARYKVPKTEKDVEDAIAEGYTEAVLGMPYALKDVTSGTCKVTVQGYAEIGPETEMQMTKTGGPDDTGYVFGAGKGILPGGEYEFEQGTTRRMVLYDADVHTTVGQEGSKWQWVDPNHSDTNKNVWEYFEDLDEYIRFIQTLALSSRTEVTITDNAFVKGSVYGGSENGIVQFNTDVKIQGGQIGWGAGETGAHPDAYWTTNSEDPTKFAECPSWTFQSPYAPYDPNATTLYEGKYYYDKNHTQEAAGGASVATDGHTYYGNVFGGGSGSVPYFDYALGRSVYLHSAGQVKGNTNVTISGGHILTNVYGGCEATNVNGTANVTMTAGTVGVPRTDTQIIAHPLTGYIFGGGKGDQRVFFNKDTNVKDAVVKIEGGRVYGSVYGGGEDGHVLRNVTLTIGNKTTTTGENNEEVTTTSGPKIGTKGTSYYDGHVFGGGRGFAGEALTAGNVGGSVDLSILDGEILGSVYGGGRLASVGYGLYLVDEEVTIGGETVKPYGTMRPDNVYDNPSKPTSSTETAAQFFTKGRGHITMTISGGTIGNNDEYAYDANNQLAHTKGGNVFAGGMGRMYVLGSTTTPISSLDWWKLGCVKSTKLTISGDAVIKSCVYGGGELGQVVGAHTAKSAANADVNVGTEVIINDGTIGTEIKDGETVKYTFGSVFGGGYGSLIEELVHDANSNPKKVSYPKYIAGRVKAGTKVNMTNGTVWASVYGGGEMAAVGESVVLGETLTTGFTGDTHVIVSGGTIGKAPITLSGSNRSYFGGAKMGNVYGGGSGHNNTVRSGHIYGNTNVTISGTDTRIYHNVYGGGAFGTVGDFTYSTSLDEQTGTNKVDGISGLHEDHPTSGVARVTITGGTIGYDGKENGMVFGSSRGDINQPEARDDYTAWVYDTHVTIGAPSSQTGPQINGTVYGSGENGHTYNNTVVTVNSGTIGIETGAEITYTENGKSVTKGGADYPYRGNVYGGGCGTDTYSVSVTEGEGESAVTKTYKYFNPLAGIVYGTTTVNVKGGKVVRNVYGAGAMGSVGTMTSTTTNGYSTLIFAGNTGKTTVAISGGTVGVDGDGNGNVFGAARGDAVSTQTDVALVKTTDVRISSAAIIKGNVYGGGEAGDVGTYYTITAEGPTKGDNIYPEDDTACGVSNVSVTGGTISGNVFGAGKGEDNTFTCQKAMVRSANVSISGGSVNGNVYGGGEIGRVEYNTVVTIGDGTNEGAGTANTTPTPVIGGSVFGAGAGVETHGYSALVRGNTKVTVQGNAKVGQNVYGGGMIASVGKYGLDNFQMPSILKGGGVCLVTVKGYAQVGPKNGGHVFGAGRGIVPNHKYGSGYDKKDWSKRMMTYSTKFVNGKTEGTDWDYSEEYTAAQKNDDNITKYIWDYLKTDDAYATYLETLALATAPNVTITGNALVNGDVYGGGERGITKGSVIVNINGGSIANDVYGGGALANTNIANWKKYEGETDSDPDYWSWDTTDKTANHTTTVNLHGGTIGHNVYGGGLGSKDPDIPALVYGDVLVELNKNITDNCIVKGVVHGANNYNGSPLGDVTVHVYKTVGWSEQAKDGNGDPVFEEDGETPVLIGHTKSATKDDTTYDLKAVYGGGNEAAYDTESYYNFDDAVNSERRAHVIIDGCDLTSIETVYGGGNAASVPATYVEVNSCYEIGTVFGGGNGLDKLDDGTINPGANVGYRMSDYQYDNTKSDEENAAAAAAAFEAQKSDLEYGSGVALAELKGGTVHSAFGGSNTLGNVRTSATVTLDEVDPDPTTGCPLCIDEIYGGGNEAEQDGTSNIELGCISYLKEIYGGSKNADINNDIALTIQSGRFNRVFGGNNLGGTIRGTITVTIEETGCHPIVIGQLYGGGNQAAYNVNNIPQAKRVTTTTAENYFMNYPKVNVKSFTSIGEIYGGGYGSSATVTGNPHVTINECVGSNSTIEMKTTTGHTDESLHTGETLTINSGQTDQVDIEMPLHKSGAIGAIGNVFGGGNAAPVSGNTNVIIGNLEYVDITTNIVVGTTDVRGYYTLSGSTFSPVTGDAAVPAVAGTTYYKKVVGADVRGNVYGGGNAAVVTGDTNVTIGKEPTE